METSSGRDSSSELSTSSSVESVSTSVMARNSLTPHLAVIKQTDVEHHQNVPDSMANTDEQSPYRTTLANKQLTEQEEYAQSGLMLLASLPSHAPESPPASSRTTPSLTITGNHVYYQHRHAYSNSTSTPSGEKFPCPPSRSISTASMNHLYDCHHGGGDIFKNLTMIPSNFLAQKNLMA
jgi:hypothetical protein